MLIRANALIAELEKRRNELAHGTLANGRPETFLLAQGEYKALSEIIELAKELAKKED